MWKDQLPHFIATCKKIEGSDINILYRYKNIYPKPLFYKNIKYEICILGAPILDNKINKEAVINLLINSSTDIDFTKIDGEFLIFFLDKEKSILRIINDRFCSIPLYYFQAESGNLITSIYYMDIWKENCLNRYINEYALFEFMWLQRLLGEKTFDKKSKFLKAATILKYNGSTIEKACYWKPSFLKTRESLHTCSEELARLIKSSLKMKTSDNPRIGLFLSGGHDSRTLLAGFEKPLVCFTLAVSKNYEYNVAKKLASIKGTRHVYLHIPENKYSTLYKKATKLGGGMYVYDHALFLDYGEEVRKYADVALHGHGLDYMFQGMYIPLHYLKLFGKRTYIPLLKKIEGDIAQFYLNNINYRLKFVNLLEYVKPKFRKDCYENLKQAVSSVIEESGVDFSSDYDKYEYLLVHALSRHYSNPNISSITTYMEQRTVSFQNDIFDFYLKIPVEYRLGGQIARMSLRILNKKLGNITAANTKMRAISSPFEKTFIQMVDSLLRKTKLIKKSIINPEDSDRTWPNRDYAIRNQEELRQAVIRASYSERLTELNFLDMDKIKKDIDTWLKTDKGGGAFMATLITVNEFLSGN